MCEYDYEERLVFASIGNHPMLKRHANNVAQNPPPPYTKTNPAHLNGGIATNNGISGLQQQQQQHSIMSLDQANHHQQSAQQSHIPQSKLQQHDDHNNNNGPANGGNCSINSNQYNASMMKIPHSA